MKKNTNAARTFISIYIHSDLYKIVCPAILNVLIVFKLLLPEVIYICSVTKTTASEDRISRSPLQNSNAIHTLPIANWEKESFMLSHMLSRQWEGAN